MNTAEHEMRSSDMGSVSRDASKCHYRDTQAQELALSQPLTPEDPQARLMRLRESAVRGSAQERINFLLNELIIETPDVQHIVSTTKQLLIHAALTPNPGGMRIVAPGGMGKNAAIRYFLRTYPPFWERNMRVCPILYIDFPGRLSKLRDILWCVAGLFSRYRSNSRA